MTTTTTTIPFFPYRLFFLYIEPISTLAGAYYAAFRQDDYLNDLSSALQFPFTKHGLPTQTRMALTQLANLYLLFVFNEHFVLSSTSSMHVWRTLLTGLLIADFGHLISMVPAGSDVFWRVGGWNAMIWGSVGFVYVGAAMRISFLAGIGMRDKEVRRMEVSEKPKVL